MKCHPEMVGTLSYASIFWY